MRACILAVAMLLVCGCEKTDQKPAKRAPPRPLPGKSQVMAPKKHPLYAILETEPRNEYELQLPNVLMKAMSPDALQQFCGQWFPDYGRDVADAYVKWRKENEATLKELVERNHAVWTLYAGKDAAYVKMVQPHLRNQLVKGIMTEFDNSPTEKFRTICREYPAQLALRSANLEVRLKKELAFLRRHPITPTT